MYRNPEWIIWFPLTFTKEQWKPSYKSEPKWSPNLNDNYVIHCVHLCGVHSSAAPWEPLALVFWERFFHWGTELPDRTMLRVREPRGPTCPHFLCTRIANVHPHSRLCMAWVLQVEVESLYSQPALCHLSPLHGLACSTFTASMTTRVWEDSSLLLKICPKNLPPFITIPEHSSYITWQEFHKINVLKNV